MRYLIPLLLLAGCAAQEQLVWTKTGVGNVSHEAASQACEYDAQRVFYNDIGSPLRARYLGEQTYKACMKSKGWSEVPVATAQRTRPEPPTQPTHFSPSYYQSDAPLSTPVTITHPTPSVSY